MKKNITLGYFLGIIVFVTVHVLLSGLSDYFYGKEVIWNKHIVDGLRGSLSFIVFLIIFLTLKSSNNNKFGNSFTLNNKYK